MRQSLRCYTSVIGLVIAFAFAAASADAADSIRIGVIHSQTGPMATSEKPLVSAAQLAVNEINEAGGVRGQQLEIVLADIRSDWDLARREAERLLKQEQVVSLFGCWTSACRQEVVPVLQPPPGGLLWYPVQYEGRENSPYVICTGAAPNQQILPAIDWAIRKFGSRVFLVGSDYIFPRTANLIIRERVSMLGATIVGEEYLPLESIVVRDVVSKIVSAHPNIVINTINGRTNNYFFHELVLASSRRQIPTLSFSIAENEIRDIGTRFLQGNYVAWNYFQSVETPENRSFVKAYRELSGQNALTSDPIEAAYFQVLAFAEAASDVPGKLTPIAIRDAALGLSMITPGGYIRIDEKSRHTWKPVRLGEIMSDGQIRTMLDSVVPVEPNPFASGQDPAPVLLPPDAQPPFMKPDDFIRMLSDPAQTVKVALTLRNLKSIPWSDNDQLNVLLAAARSPVFQVRYEVPRAVKDLTAPRHEVIDALLNSQDSFDLVEALRLLGREESVDEKLAGRAKDLLKHKHRRVKLAAGTALLAQAMPGWRADAEATSSIIAGFEDIELGIQRNALALSGFSEQFVSRVLPMLANIDLRSRPSFFRRALCEAMSHVLIDRAAESADTGGRKAIDELEGALMQIERSDCLPTKDVTALRTAVERAAKAADKGFLYWITEQFRANFTAGIIVSLILASLLLEFLALVLAIIMLALSPARLIATLRKMSRLDGIRVSLWRFEASLFDALSPTWLKSNRRALRAWVNANINAYRDAFARSSTVQLRQKHVPLPAIFPGKTDALEPSPEEIHPLVQDERLKLHIVGEGGTGKTSLACEIGRWAMSSDSSKRIGSLHPRRNYRDCLIAVMFEPNEPLNPTPEGFLAAMQRKLTVNGPLMPLWLVRGLIDHGLVLAVVDDVLEIEGLAEILASPELSSLWLIATSRVDLPAGMGDWRIVCPQKLRGRILTEFFVNYTKISGHADKMGDDDIEAYVTQFKQLLGADESRQETVVYFARLFLDYILDVQLQDGVASDAELGHRRPRSVPELVESFVDSTCRHAAKRHKLNRIEVVGLVRKAAYIAISGRHRPGPLPLDELAKEADGLKQELGIPSNVHLDEVLVDSGLLDRPTAYHLRFKIDLVHEYCAVLHMRDRAAACPTRKEAYDLWKNWLDKIRTATDMQLQSSGLLKAIYECLRSDRVAAEVPEDLLALVADLLGIERHELQPIRIGILHSLQGTMAMSEVALRDAALLAVKEINEGGGIAGRRLEAIVRDGASDEDTFAREARRLIREDGVSSIFGCWTSATRKRVKPVVESEHSLLWYPVQYEGYEQSEAIIYTGAAPNQQIIPAVEWCLGSLLPEQGVDISQARFYLVGSDYVFPRRANAIIRRRLQEKNIEPVGEQYAPLIRPDFEEIVKDIQRVEPHVVINTINGSGNINFFRTLAKYGLNATKCPVISLSVAEAEIRDIGAQRLKGHYAVWNYFQSLSSPANEQFVNAFQEEYGMGRVTSDPIATAYAQIKLFAEAARRARVLTPEELREQLTHVQIDTPAGWLRFDQKTGHFSKHVYIGKVNDEGQFDVVEVWNEGQLVPPEPFPFPDLSEAFAKEGHL